VPTSTNPAPGHRLQGCYRGEAGQTSPTCGEPFASLRSGLPTDSRPWSELVQRVSAISKMLFLLVVGNSCTARTVTLSGEPWCVMR
jgi:hypothetical protein